MVLKRHYLFDTGAFIRLCLEPGFAPIRGHLTGLGDAGRASAPMEVYAEIQARDDAAATWCRKNKKLFRHPTENEVGVVTEVMGKFPDTVKWKSKIDADPWLIAFALDHKRLQANELISTEEMIIVTEDDRALRHVCDSYSLPKITLVQMLIAEGLLALPIPKE